MADPRVLPAAHLAAIAARITGPAWAYDESSLRSDARRLLAHAEALGAALAEWKLRAAYNRHEHETPAEHRGSGRCSAYWTGFEWAWRGVEFENIYERADCRRAISAGYLDGEDAFRRALSGSPPTGEPKESNHA